MKNLKAKFFKYHRQLGIIFALPLALCAITAMGITISDKFFDNEAMEEFFVSLHTMEILGIEEIYSFIVGISTLALIFTGLMCLVHTKKKKPD